jgi:hypothetical protein
MNSYPDAVARIADDYLERLKFQLHSAPVREQEEFLREIRSHIYEAYHQAAGADDVARILMVLRKLGDPGEVVSVRFPDVMVRSGARRSWPLYVVGGILIALYGIPLGFGGVAVLVGVLAAMAGVLAAYYVTAASMFLVATIFMLLGLIRIGVPGIWDRLVSVGIIQMHPDAAYVFEQLPVGAQGFLLIVFAAVFAAIGLGMLWIGKYLVRGLRFLVSLLLDSLRQLVEKIRRRLHQEGGSVRFGRSTLHSRSSVT